MLDNQLEELTQRIAIEFYRARSMMMGSVPKQIISEPLIKPMTTYISNNQIASASSQLGAQDSISYTCWQAFDGKADEEYNIWMSARNKPILSETTPQWLQIEFTDGPRTVNRYEFSNRPNGNDIWLNSPRDWQLLGRNSDNDEWTVIHTVDDDLQNMYPGTRSYSNFGSHTYSQFRMNITEKNAGDETAVIIADLQLFGSV